MPCHSYHIYRIWRSKEVEGRFKVIIWGWQCKLQKEAGRKDEGEGGGVGGGGEVMMKGGYHHLILLY